MKETYKNNNEFPNNKNSYGTLTSGNADNYALRNIPTGLSSAFTQNAAAMTAFENMDEDKKRAVIEMANKVKSRKEMHKLVQNIAINNL